MKAETFHLELITPCFCAGAEPDQQAEIRAPSIRGQLRWWFRTLGGFKSLAPKPVKDQESLVFGSTAGNKGQAGKLIVRVVSHGLKSEIRDGQEIGHRNFSDPAYLTFPIQTRERDGQKIGYSGRGVIVKGSFKLHLVWRGEQRLWDDVRALATVFGHFGSLGFRGRRAMGALGFEKNHPLLSGVFNRFNQPCAVTVRTLGVFTSDKMVGELGGWLKRWRAYGRTGKNAQEAKYPGFKMANADHDHGAAVLAHNELKGPTFRPAIGLPIVQFFSSSKQTINWEFSNGDQTGRFASPVILRPHRDAQGKWHALVIFVDAHKWPTGQKVQLTVNGKTEERAVSLDLYEAMKLDPKLGVFG